MGPADLVALIQIIQAAISAAPQVAEIAIKAKEFVSSLFGGGLITQAQQEKVHAHVDEVCAAAIAGKELPEWMVEADPS